MRDNKYYDVPFKAFRKFCAPIFIKPYFPYIHTPLYRIMYYEGPKGKGEFCEGYLVELKRWLKK